MGSVSEQHHFSISDSQNGEFEKLLAGHRSHRSHSSHRSHYSGRGLGSTSRHSSHYSSRISTPSYTAPSPLYSTPAKKKATTSFTPRKFHNWQTKEYKVNSVEDPCASTTNFEWCLDQGKITNAPKTATPQDLINHATLKVIFPKGPVNITQSSSLSYSVDGAKAVHCKITRVVPLYHSTEVYFEPPNTESFDNACKRGNHLRFTISSAGHSQEASFSLAGFTKAQKALIQEVHEALKDIRE